MAGQRTDGSRAGTEEVRQELPPTQPTADKGPGKLTELDRRSWLGVLRRVRTPSRAFRNSSSVSAKPSFRSALQRSGSRSSRTAFCSARA